MPQMLMIKLALSWNDEIFKQHAVTRDKKLSAEIFIFKRQNPPTCSCSLHLYFSPSGVYILKMHEKKKK